MKLVGLVFLGFIAIIIVGLLLDIVIAKVFPRISGDDGYLWVAFLITMPVAFLVGSIVTGYFSYYELENKWALLWMAPALYWNVLFMCVAGIQFLLDSFISVNPRTTGFLYGTLLPLLIGLYWYLASLAGVILGYFTRGRIVRWWYGD
jgi:hypothetical protein